MICLLIAISMTTTGCQTAAGHSDQQYRNLYSGYRALVEKAIAEHTENQLADLTKQYFAKAEEHLILIRVSKQDESEKWQVLLQLTDPHTKKKLPKIHWADSANVHIHEGDNYVLLETNKTLKGNYESGLYITIAVSKSSR